MDISQLLNADGSGSQLTTLNQGLKVSDSDSFDGCPFFASNLSNQVNSTDAIQFDSSFHILSNSGRQSSQNYSFADTLGHSYKRTLTATNNVLTSDTGGK